MPGIRFLRLSLLILFLLIMPTAVFAQVAVVSSVQWTSAKSFHFVTTEIVRAFRTIELVQAQLLATILPSSTRRLERHFSISVKKYQIRKAGKNVLAW